MKGTAKMDFSGVAACAFLILSTFYAEAALNPEKDNVCLKTITYSETIKATVHRPASKRDAIQCLKEGKYCEEEIVIDMREPRVRVRTKIVPTCCEGYEEDPEGTHCVPVCPNGCGNGKCVAPGKCFCEAGFFGSECEKICDEGRWGENCVLACNCSENETCDKMSGCRCRPGWMGDRCASPCPEGFYGFLCEEKCSCDAHVCDRVTGACVKPEEAPSAKSVFEEGKTEKEPETVPVNVSVATNERGFVLTYSNLSASASGSEPLDKKLTATPGENEEGVTRNLTYFKEPVQAETKGRPDESVQVESSTFGKPAQVAKEKARLPETTTTEAPGTRKTIDVSKELTSFSELEKKVFHGNEPGSFQENADSGSVQGSRAGNFIPTFSVLSGIAVLILLIAGKWLMLTIRKKVRKMATEELGCSEEELNILPGGKFIWENNLENHAYVNEILQTAPILQTFKPDTAGTDNSATKGKIILASG